VSLIRTRRSGFSRDAFSVGVWKERASRLKPLLQNANRVRPCFLALAFGLASATSAAAPHDEFPSSVSQGALVIGKVAPGSQVRYAGRDLLLTPEGDVVFGIGRDEAGPVTVEVRSPHAKPERIEIAVTPRDWPVERVDGVPPKTVEPPPDIAARIKREQARVVAARVRNDARADFLETFAWPVEGRISGRFGSQRIYNGIPKSPHPGMDIAVPQGTPVCQRHRHVRRTGSVSHRRHRSARPWPRRELELPAPVAHRRESRRSHSPGTGHRRSRHDGTRNRSAPALGHELVRCAVGSAVAHGRSKIVARAIAVGANTVFQHRNSYFEEQPAN
jgi:hypothetical protein